MGISSVGVVGVGTMGSPIARHLLKRRYRVTVYDVQQKLVAALVNQGASPAQSPREVAANSELTLVVVVDDFQVKEVCLGSEGMLEGAPPNTGVAICNTVQAQTCREVGEKAQVRGIHVLDTPMIRGVQAAVEGNLLLMIGGDLETLERCRPVFNTFASDIHYLGNLGCGQIGKMVNNLILWACMTASREGIILAKSQGVDPYRLRGALLNGSADNFALREWDRATKQPKWWHQKDLHGVLLLAEEAQTPMPISALVKEVIKGFGPEEAQKLFMATNSVSNRDFKKEVT